MANQRDGKGGVNRVRLGLISTDQASPLQRYRDEVSIDRTTIDRTTIDHQYI